MGRSNIPSASLLEQADHRMSALASSSSKTKSNRRLRDSALAAKRTPIKKDLQSQTLLQSRGYLSGAAEEQFSRLLGNSWEASERAGPAPRHTTEGIHPGDTTAVDYSRTAPGIYGRQRGSPSYREGHSAQPPTRSRSSERYFIIETGSPVAEERYSGHTDLEVGLETEHASTYRRIMDHLAKVMNAVPLARAFGGLSVTGRKRLQYLIILATFAGASTCVSVMSVAGTNSLVITGAITAILALGKILCDVLADRPGDGVVVP